MKLLFCAALLVAAAATAGGQEGASGAAKQKPTAQASGSATVTLTGCLQADKNRSVFWLSDASTADVKGAAAGGTTASTPGATGAGAAPSTGKVDQMKKTAAAETYRLNPAANVSLQGHVGHKVEITGTMDRRGTTMGARGTSGATADRPPAEASSATTAEAKHLEKARQVNVTALKHISPVCEPGKQ